MWFFTHVWIIPALMALSFLLILLFGKRCPSKGAEIGIAAVGAAFVLALVAAGNWIAWTNDNPEVHATGAEGVALADVDPSCSKVADEAVHEGESRARRGRRHADEADSHAESGSDGEHGAAGATVEGESLHRPRPLRTREVSTTRPPGRRHLRHLVRDRRPVDHHRHPRRRPVGADARRRHAHLAAGAHLLHRLRPRRPPLHPLLRLPRPVHRVDALLRPRREHAADDRRLGAGRRLLLRAHRPLVGGEAELRRRAQGVPHQPRRRRRPAHRRDHPVLRRRQDASTILDINMLRQRRRRSATRCCSSASLLPDRRGHVEVGPVHPAHLAARRHGRPDAGLGAHPRRHHGRGRRLHGRPPLPGVLRGPLHRRGSIDQPAGRHRCASPRCSAPLLAFVQNDIKKVLAYSTRQPARLHGHGARRRRLDRGDVPPLHPRLLQGLPVPRRRLGQPRLPPQLRHGEDMGGLRKIMPKTFWTFVIAHRAPSPASSRSPASGRRTRSSPAPAPARHQGERHVQPHAGHAAARRRSAPPPT